MSKLFDIINLVAFYFRWHKVAVEVDVQEDVDEEVLYLPLLHLQLPVHPRLHQQMLSFSPHLFFSPSNTTPIDLVAISRSSGLTTSIGPSTSASVAGSFVGSNLP